MSPSATGARLAVRRRRPRRVLQGLTALGSGLPVAVRVGAGYPGGGGGTGLPKCGGDPSVGVAPDHSVSVAYRRYRHSHVHPMVAISHDHGATFARVSRLASPVRNNWGDRDFIT